MFEDILEIVFYVSLVMFLLVLFVPSSILINWNSSETKKPKSYAGSKYKPNGDLASDIVSDLIDFSTSHYSLPHSPSSHSNSTSHCHDNDDCGTDDSD